MTRGGSRHEYGQIAADNSDCMQEGELAGVEVGLQRGPVHQLAHRAVLQQQAAELLPHQVGPLAAQHDAVGPQGSLQCVERGCNLGIICESGEKQPIQTPKALRTESTCLSGGSLFAVRVHWACLSSDFSLFSVSLILPGETESCDCAVTASHR